MRRLTRNILLLAVLAGIMFFTVPEEEKHVDKLTKEIVASVKDNPDDDDSLLEEIGNAIVGAVSEKAVHVYVKNMLTVENYYVVNVGKMHYDGEKRVVTIGAFNHVFCIVKAYDLLDEIKQ